jgi:hypothetical protein
MEHNTTNVAEVPDQVIGEPVGKVTSAEAGQSLGEQSSASNDIDESAFENLNVRTFECRAVRVFC